MTHKIEIEIAESFTVTRGKDESMSSVEIDVTKLSPEILTQLALHGLKQKVADSAAGAASVACGADWEKMTTSERRDWVADNGKKIAESAKGLMQNVVTNLTNGDWGVQRSGGAGLDPVMAMIVKIIRPMVKDAKPEQYKNADPATRTKYCISAFEQQPEDVQQKLREQAEARIAAEQAARKATAKLSIEL